jgi:hypothetical protein
VFDVIGTVTSGGSTRDLHQSGTAFCNPLFGGEVVKPNEMHRRMKTEYGDACLLQQQVYEWDRKFKNGVSSVVDADSPCRSNTACTLERV